MEDPRADHDSSSADSKQYPQAFPPVQAFHPEDQGERHDDNRAEGLEYGRDIG